MITDDIFNELRTIERTLTENQFTTKYLRTSRSYLSNRRNVKRDVSDSVLIRLCIELANAASKWEQASVYALQQEQTHKCTELSEFYKSLSEKAINKLFGRG